MQIVGINSNVQASSFKGQKSETMQTKATRKMETKSEINNFVSEFKKGTGITAKGNKYEKATGGKIVGGISGAIVGTFCCPIFGTILGGFVGILGGHLFDNFITNKNRAIEADVNAAKLNTNA